jgi:hypothetical protein
MPINSFLYPGAKVTPVYEVANSVRYNDDDSPSMTKASTTVTNDKKFTVSAWCKRTTLGDGSGNEFGIFSHISDSNNANKNLQFGFYQDHIYCAFVDGGSVTVNKVSNALYQDPSSWYHVMLAVDSTQGTAANRNRIYVNGTEVTSFSTDTNAGENETFLSTSCNITVGRYTNTSGSHFEFDGYLAEVVYIDGLQLTPSSFGEFDEDSPTIFKPINVSGLTFGNNGFYLDFEDSSNLGNDANGGTDLTEANLAATDQSTDTCTNNFATMNPLDVSLPSTFALSEGNLDALLNGFSSSGGNTYPRAFSTFQLTSGKWYAECKITEENDSGVIGISARSAISYVNIGGTNYDWLGINAHDYRYYHDGTKMNNNSSSSYGTTWDGGDTIGVALDLDNLAVYFSLNGTFQASGDPTSGSSRTNAAFNLTAVASTPNGAYKIGIGTQGDANQTQGVWNFGSPPYAISSGNSDANGYGNFEYSVPSGYYSLCTKNLAEFG